MNSFATRSTFELNGQRYHYASLAKLGQRFDLKRLPYSLNPALESLLRHEDGVNVTAKSRRSPWDAKKEPDTGSRSCRRVVLRDFTGIAVREVDLAAMRDAVVKLGGDAKQINRSRRRNW